MSTVNIEIADSDQSAPVSIEIADSNETVNVHISGAEETVNVQVHDIVLGLPGDTGAAGADSTIPGPAGADSTVPGPAGADSTVPGPAGTDGVGVPVGGSAGQVLAKASATSYDTQWIDPAAGGGGGGGKFVDGTAPLDAVYTGGKVGIETLTPNAQLEVVGQLGTDVVQIVKGASGQTANLQEWKDAGGNTLVEIKPDGEIRVNDAGIEFFNSAIPNARNSARIYMDVDQRSASSGALYVDPVVGGTRMFFGTPTRSIALDFSNTSALQNLPVTIFPGNVAIGASSSSHNIGRVGNKLFLNASGPSSAGFLFYLNSSTYSGYQTGSAVVVEISPEGQLKAYNTSHVGGADGTKVVQTIQGAAGQTANLQEWKDAAGTTMAAIAPDGSLQLPSQAERVALFGDSNYTTKYIQIRDGAVFAVRWGLQANNNTSTPGTTLMQSAKAIAFRAGGGADSFAASSVAHLFVDLSGEVGVGTTNPQAQLEVEAAANRDLFRVTRTGRTSLVVRGTNGNAYLFEESATNDKQLVLASTGNVGIGLLNPSEKLEVAGKIKATSINFTGLPTSPVGLVSGDIWDDNKTLKIV